ncbi:hypothetical protein COO60DRAFT_1488557, partial [Scenedesmus sp. NREL 46B-D3]
MLASLFVLLLSCFDKLCSSLALLINASQSATRPDSLYCVIIIIIITLPIQAIASAP